MRYTNTLLTFLLLFCAILYSSSIFSQSKGGRWRFENNGYDTADWDNFANDGTLQGIASYSAAAPLQEGVAYLSIEDVSTHNYLLIEDSNDLDFNDENIGISLWLFPTSIDGTVQFILNKGDQYPQPKSTNYSLRVSKTNNLEFLIRDANDKARKVASRFTISENQWTFVAVFYDFAASKVYMWNQAAEIPVDTLDFSESIFSNDAPLAIGSWYTSDPLSPSTNDFHGRIDDVRISGRLQDIFPIQSSVGQYESEGLNQLPAQMQIFPNPISLSGGNKSIKINTNLQMNEPVSITIYNLLGQIIFNRSLEGYTSHTLRWDLTNNNGDIVNTGIYFVKSTIGGKICNVQKMIIVK